MSDVNPRSPLNTGIPTCFEHRPEEYPRVRDRYTVEIAKAVRSVVALLDLEEKLCPACSFLMEVDALLTGVAVAFADQFELNESETKLAKKMLVQTLVAFNAGRPYPAVSETPSEDAP